ncbi:MAG: PAS domain S-box protein, partial [Chloroflexi bacterium]|nr:PAS domain S-box protein [Chloroflexota bacterium]
MKSDDRKKGKPARKPVARRARSSRAKSRRGISPSPAASFSIQPGDVSLTTEHKKTEEALQKSERHYRTLVENAIEGIVVTQDGKIKFANPLVAIVSGYSTEELQSMSLKDLVYPDDEKAIIESLGKSAVPGTLYITPPFRFQTKGGERRWIEATVVSIIWDDKAANLNLLRDITESKRAEEALRESEERYRFLVELSPEAILVSSEGKHVFVNSAGVKLLGASSPDQIIGKPVTDFIHPDYREIVAERMRKAMEIGIAPPIMEEKFIRFDKTEIDVEVRAAPLVYRGKMAMQAVVSDITERKQAEHEKSIILTAMSEHVVYQDLEHRVLWANRAAAESVGLASEDLVGRYCYEIWQQRSLPCENCPVAKARETGMPQENETSSPDGRFWLVRGYPVIGPDGVVSGAIEVTQDVTGRKQAEEALAAEAIRRRILIDQSRDGIVVLDEDAKLYEANQRFAEMLGYTPEELRELHTWDWDTQWTREELLEMGRSVDEAGVLLETRHRRKDGTVFDVDISVNSAVIAGQKLLFCVSRDITERKRAEETIRRSEQNFRDSIENSPLGIRIANEHGKTLYANRALLDIWGYSSLEELEAVPRKQRYTPESYDEHRERVEKRKRGEPVPLSYDISIARSDGQVRHLSASRGEMLWNGESQFQVVYQDITERKQAEEGMWHLSLVLRAIRNVNQLIARGADRDTLFKGVCENFVKTRGYYNAWIALLDESGKLVTAAEAGLGKDFLQMIERLKRGELPDCGRKALKKSGVVVIKDPPSACTDCPLAKDYSGRGGMSIRLEYGGKVYGLMTVSTPLGFLGHKEENDLFEGVAGGIAFGLHSMEQEEERSKAEEALRDSEERYRRLSGTADEGVWIVDDECRTTF